MTQVPSLVRELAELLEPTWPMFKTSGLVAEAQPDDGGEEGTPAETPEAPEGTPAETQEVNWSEEGPRFQQRYEDLRPQYDRTHAQLSQYEQLIQGAQAGDPEALGLLGLEIEQEQEEPDEFEDPTLARLEALEARLAQEDEQVQQQQYLNAEIDFVNEGLSAVNEQVKKETGQELSQEAIDAIGDLSRTDRFREEDGAPNVRAAFEHLQQIREADKKAYAQGKRRAVLPPEGIPGSEKVNLKDEQSRQAAMARVMEAEEAD